MPQDQDPQEIKCMEAIITQAKILFINILNHKLQENPINTVLPHKFQL